MHRQKSACGETLDAFARPSNEYLIEIFKFSMKIARSALQISFFRLPTQAQVPCGPKIDSKLLSSQSVRMPHPLVMP